MSLLSQAKFAPDDWVYRVFQPILSGLFTFLNGKRIFSLQQSSRYCTQTMRWPLGWGVWVQITTVGVWPSIVGLPFWAERQSSRLTDENSSTTWRERPAWTWTLWRKSHFTVGVGVGVYCRQTIVWDSLVKAGHSDYVNTTDLKPNLPNYPGNKG